jgi:hypothetical protein
MQKKTRIVSFRVDDDTLQAMKKASGGAFGDWIAGVLHGVNKNVNMDVNNGVNKNVNNAPVPDNSTPEQKTQNVNTGVNICVNKNVNTPKIHHIDDLGPDGLRSNSNALSR